jgi:antitoxin component YwqK of YwqJK toxin-antitoxin module
MSEELGLGEKIVLRDEDGNITEEAFLKGGVLEGEVLLYSRGRLAVRSQYVGGKQHGDTLHYDTTGQVSVKGNYQNGKQHGEWQYFNATGNIVRKASFENGELHGWVADYHLNGRPREISAYRAGLLDGEVLRYSDEGKLLERVCFEVGKPKPCPKTSAAGSAQRKR